MRPRSFRKNAHSSFFFLLIRGIAASCGYNSFRWVSLSSDQISACRSFSSATSSAQRPNFGLPFFQFRNILSIEMPGAVDAAANLVDIPGNPADGCGQFLLLGVIHLDDVTVNRHLAEICTHVPGAPMFLVPSCAILFWMSRRSCSVTQNSMRIGLVRSAIGYSPPQTTTDKFSAFVHSCAKFCCSLYNGHFFSRLAGMTGKKF